MVSRDGKGLKMALKVKSEVSQSCPTFCNPMDCSAPGFFVHGIFQARILGWAAIYFSRGYIHVGLSQSNFIKGES